MANKNSFKTELFFCIGLMVVMMISCNNSNQSHLRKGNHLLESGDFLGAKRIFEEIIEKNPDNFSAQYGLGMSWCAEAMYKTELGLAKPEDWYKALYHTTVAMNIKEEPQVIKTLAILHFNLGACYKKINDQENAIKLFEQALLYDPKLLKALNLLGSLYHERKAYDKARSCYEQALVVQPGYAMTHFNLGALDWAQNRYSDAEIHFRKAVSLDSQNTYYTSWLNRIIQKNK